MLNADHAGFLRSTQALIQIIGRAARNANGKAILYADKITPAMQQAMTESQQRRERQVEYNKAHNITPASSQRKKAAIDNNEPTQHSIEFCSNLSELCQQITATEKELLVACDKNDEIQVGIIREKLNELYRQFIFM